MAVLQNACIPAWGSTPLAVRDVHFNGGGYNVSHVGWLL